MQTEMEMFPWKLRQWITDPEKQVFEVHVGNYTFYLKNLRVLEGSILIYLWFFAGTDGEGF